jgi:GTPase
MNELERYNPELLDKHRIVAVSKCELLDEELKQEVLQELSSLEENILFFSSLANIGLAELKDAMWDVISAES